MTPAFLNRFKIIYLEDQLLDINLKEFLEYKINELGNKKKETLLPSKSRKRLNQRYIKTEKIDNKKEENDKLILDLFNKIKEDNKNILNSISFLSFFIESVYIFKSELKNKNIENKVVIDYIFQLINPEQKNIIINNKIFEEIKKILEENDKENRSYNNAKANKYFFLNSKELTSFLINAYSSYLIHMHMRFEGPTGIGKTIGACALAKIISKNKKFYIQSFHSGTKPLQCFGGSTIINNKVDIKDGLLTLAMTEGTVFIADEFNLSTKETMKSILPSIIIPFK